MSLTLDRQAAIAVCFAAAGITATFVPQRMILATPHSMSARDASAPKAPSPSPTTFGIPLNFTDSSQGSSESIVDRVRPGDGMSDGISPVQSVPEQARDPEGDTTDAIRSPLSVDYTLDVPRTTSGATRGLPYTLPAGRQERSSLGSTSEAFPQAEGLPEGTPARPSADIADGVDGGTGDVNVGR